MKVTDKIFVAGHRGMVGSAIMRNLYDSGFSNIVTKNSKELDLRDQLSVENFFVLNKPDYVFLAAAKVGGINANNIYRGEFLYDNLMMEANVIHHSYKSGVKKLLFLGSSCIYPKFADQPIKEDSLLTGSLEETNEPYAIAKIAGVKLCENYNRQYGTSFISAMPTNLYGPNDNYDLKNSHVLPALLRKFHAAKVEGAGQVEIWGSGTPLREFLHVNDLAEACIFLMSNYDQSDPINVGSGFEISIKDLAFLIKNIVGFKGEVNFNRNMPDGTPRKLMSSERIKNLGWSARIELEEGIFNVYNNLDKSDW